MENGKVRKGANEKVLNAGFQALIFGLGQRTRHSETWTTSVQTVDYTKIVDHSGLMAM